jgi:AcrR family transcriptional regulator
MDAGTVIDMQREQALDCAMRLFWARGVKETSYATLVEATGLSRKALYARWPDKMALIHEALRHYCGSVLRPQIARLRPPGVTSLEDYWTRIDQDARQPGWNGCLLTRSATGELRGEAWAQGLLDAHLQAMREAFVSALVAAGRETRARTRDPEAMAWQAVALVTLASTLGGDAGYDARVAAVFRAGRLACGLMPA